MESIKYSIIYKTLHTIQIVSLEERKKSYLLKENEFARHAFRYQMVTNAKLDPLQNFRGDGKDKKKYSMTLNVLQKWKK